jgi:hypothetical protein
MVFARRERKQTAKSADAGKHLGTSCALYQRLDAFDKFVACIDIDTGVFVRKWFIAHDEMAYSARAI